MVSNNKFVLLYAAEAALDINVIKSTQNKRLQKSLSHKLNNKALATPTQTPVWINIFMKLNFMESNRTSVFFSVQKSRKRLNQYVLAQFVVAYLFTHDIIQMMFAE